MEKRCEKCDGPLIKKDNGKHACSVCDPPVFFTTDENEPLSTSSKIVAPAPIETTSPAAEPPKLNTNKAPDSGRSEELSDNNADLLPPTASRSLDAPPVSPPPIPIPSASLPPTSSPPVAPPVEGQPDVDSGGKTAVNDSILKSTIAENERVLLPDGHGGFIETSERKTQINFRGAKIALSSMKRDEREASRGLKNFLVVTFCVVFLLILMLVLSWLQGPSR